MKIFLIRHGETVDNIAGLYAGVRDSQLTNYGVDQTKKLGDYLASTQVKLTHIFASPLTRANQTAEAIHRSQSKLWKDDINGTTPPSIIKVPDLIEQNFGFYEGKSFQARSSPNKSGRESHADHHRGDVGFVDVETKDSMARRADNFLVEHLLPLTTGVDGASELVIAVVSHGMLLSTLWRRMLLRITRGSLTIAPEVTAARGPVVLEHLGGWSNTGYLELSLHKSVATSSIIVEDESITAKGTSLGQHDESAASERSPITNIDLHLNLKDYSVTILAIDSRAHLAGLKRQRGGIGRLAHDVKQRKVDSFFKKPSIG